jgi:hypothetical protein
MTQSQTQTQQYQNLNKKLFVIETWTVEQVLNWARGKNFCEVKMFIRPFY